MTGPRQAARRRLHALASAQAGYVTAAQALELGYSYQAQKYHADAGNWERVDRGLYRLPDWPVDANDVFVRWSLWSSGRGVVSHESALSVHDLSDVDPPRVHLTVDRDFAARDPAVVLHVARLTTQEIEDRGAWSVTTPVRTLLDVAATPLAQEHIERAVVDALTSGLVTRRRLLRATDGAEANAALRLERALAEVGPP